jgi:hypothetical protein
MMLQLGELERGGCIRLDQVWNAPNGSDELAENYLAANKQILNVLEGPSKKFQARAQAIHADLQVNLRNLAKPDTQTSLGRARRERFSTVEMLESDAKAAGKAMGESRQTKRAREEKGVRRRSLRGGR